MMSRLSIVILLLCLACQAADRSPSKEELKQAQKDFQRAIELQKAGKIEDALEAANAAAALVPGNFEYLTGREMLKLQVAGTYAQLGNQLAEKGSNPEAATQFRAALSLDPQNTYIQQRLRDVLPPENPEKEHILTLLASVDQIEVVPKPGKASLHVKGDTRALYDQIGRAFGVSMVYEQAMQSHQVRFDVQDVDFQTAMKLAGQVTKTFWAPLSKVQVIVANDSQEMRRQYERLSMRTFYVNNTNVPTDLNDLVNVIRTVLEVRLVTLQPAKNTIVVRAPKAQIDLIAPMIDEIDISRKEAELLFRSTMVFERPLLCFFTTAIKHGVPVWAILHDRIFAGIPTEAAKIFRSIGDLALQAGVDWQATELPKEAFQLVYEALADDDRTLAAQGRRPEHAPQEVIVGHQHVSHRHLKYGPPSTMGNGFITSSPVPADRRAWPAAAGATPRRRVAGR